MAEEKRWYCYNHAAFCDCEPHEEADITMLCTGELWKTVGKNAVLARYTHGFDCGYETDWWYIIKDTPFDIGTLKSSRRNKINRGRRMFYLEKIVPTNYTEELFRVQTAAYSSYPEKYRPDSSMEDMIKCAKDWAADEKAHVFACFFRESGLLCGYAVVLEGQKCLNYAVLKADPAYERYYLNYILMADVLEYFSEKLANGHYITNGERNIQHETNFQELLENYFGYRKAYCKLNVEYNPRYKWLVKILYGFRGVCRRFNNIRIMHKINGVLKMEEIVRLQRKVES